MLAATACQNVLPIAALLKDWVATSSRLLASGLYRFRTASTQSKNSGDESGEIQQYLKTKNGERDVDLCVDLAQMLKAYVGTRTSGLLFQTSSGKQVSQRNILRDSLHPSLKGLAHVRGGFNIFRRYRLTLLDTSGCPETLRNFWSGHAHSHVSERYIKLWGEREYRLEWAERIGLGFKIPGSVGQPGLLRVVASAA